MSYCAVAQIAYAVSVKLTFAPFLGGKLTLYPSTLHPVAPVGADEKTVMSAGMAVLPFGKVEANPPDNTFVPFGHLAIAVPDVRLEMLTPVPTIYCSPERPGIPWRPCGPAGPVRPWGP